MTRVRLRDKFSVDKEGDILFVADKRDWPEDHAEGFIRVYAVKQDDESSVTKKYGDTDYDRLLKYLTTDYCERKIRTRTALAISSILGVITAFICLALALTLDDSQMARIFAGLCIVVSVLSYTVSKLLDKSDSRIYRAFPQSHVFEARVDESTHALGWRGHRTWCCSRIRTQLSKMTRSWL